MQNRFHRQRGGHVSTDDILDATSRGAVVASGMYSLGRLVACPVTGVIDGPPGAVTVARDASAAPLAAGPVR